MGDTIFVGNIPSQMSTQNGTITITRGSESCDGPTDEWGNFSFGVGPGECPTPIDLVANDLVTASDGTATKEHTVFALAVTAVDDAEGPTLAFFAAGSDMMSVVTS